MRKFYKFWLLKWHPSYVHASKFTKSKHTSKTKIALYYLLTPYPKNRLVIQNVINIYIHIVLCDSFTRQISDYQSWQVFIKLIVNALVQKGRTYMGMQGIGTEYITRYFTQSLQLFGYSHCQP
jgi:hypothetical protein